MENLKACDSQEPEAIAEHDILSMLAMLDYLVAEIGKFDVMAAHCLLLARKSLLDAVGDSLVTAH
jgi:hypothetical protein